MLIRILTLEDMQAFWALRLEALKNQPTAFSSSYEESVLTPEEQIRERLENSDDKFVLGAFTPTGELVGMAGYRRERNKKLRHKAMIWGVYVNPLYRAQGIGRSLMTEVLKRVDTPEGPEQLNLAVVTSNEAAVNLYKSVGFEVYGLERRAIKVDGEYYDEYLMEMFLKR